MGGGGGGRALPFDVVQASSSSERSIRSNSSASFFLAAAALAAPPDFPAFSSSLGTGFQLPSLSRLTSFSSPGSSFDSMISCWKQRCNLAA
jgi:hypothetical protein